MIVEMVGNGVGFALVEPRLERVWQAGTNLVHAVAPLSI
jgi:hypothetical protein